MGRVWLAFVSAERLQTCRSNTGGGWLQYHQRFRVEIWLLRPQREARYGVLPLVERFDIEPRSDFSAKWSNFVGLVLFCIDAKFCKKIFVGKLLTRSTRFTCFCTAQTSIFQKNFVTFFRIFWQILQKFKIHYFLNFRLFSFAHFSNPAKKRAQSWRGCKVEPAKLKGVQS